MADLPVHKVTLWPNGESFSCNEDTTLLKALKDNNHYVKSSCGGVASCTDCVIKIHTGENSITPPTFGEIKLLGNVFHITKERLSCQVLVKGNVTIDITKHDEEKDQTKTANKKYIKKKSPTIRRTSEEAKELADKARAEANKVPEKKPETWHKHWEKNPEQADAEKNKPKFLGGNKKPRAFDFKDEE